MRRFGAVMAAAAALAALGMSPPGARACGDKILVVGRGARAQRVRGAVHRAAILALPAPEGDAYARTVFEAPQGEVEESVARIWAGLLGIHTISRNDNFFALGGHSLLVVRMLDHLRAQGIEIDVRSVFARPVLRELAESANTYRSLTL